LGEGRALRKKSKKAADFVNGLHDFVVSNPQFRKRTAGKSETQIQAEIRPLIIRYLEDHFAAAGYKDAVAKANKSFYWEGQEGSFGTARNTTFGSRNYPDFIIQEPYLVAIEYKQSANGSIVKHGIGQSMMHTLCGDFDFVYYLFHDESKDKRIESSIGGKTETTTLERMWEEFNVLIKFV
jgi:hypothetical protein